MSKYTLFYPVIECSYCDDPRAGSPCRYCKDTGELENATDNSPMFPDLPNPAVLRYNEIHSAEMEGADLVIAEKVFELFNIGDRPVRCRSMSVGDRLQIDNRLYVCAPFGFELVEPVDEDDDRGFPISRTRRGQEL